ncbi:MAG TPA: hypothetical protein VFR97_05015 [Capillimicrobium sp.]|nr:hypothetical protein [Capillimicrobium sp.]
MPPELRPFRRNAGRHRPVLELSADKWSARLVVTPIDLMRERLFEVAAHWHGPPMHGYPPVPAEADRSDTLFVEDLELARAIAMAAIDHIRASRVPDLRELQRRFEGRGNGSIQASFDAFHRDRLGANR